MNKSEMKELRKKFWKALRQKFRESDTQLKPGGTKNDPRLLFKLGVKETNQPAQQNIGIVWSDDGMSFILLSCSLANESIHRPRESTILVIHENGFATSKVN